MKQSWIVTGLGALLLLGTQPRTASAFDWFGGRLSIGGGYGRVKPKLPYSFQDNYQDGEAWAAHVQYFLNNDVSILASYADLEPYRRGNKGDQFHYRPIVGSVRYNLFHHLPFTPYLTAGAGYSTNRHEIPNAPTVKWDGFTYQAGLGLEFFVTEGTSLGAEALYHHFEGDGSNHPYRMASLMGTLNFHFGPGPTQRREEEALKRQKEEAEKAKADADTAKNQLVASQQQTLTAQQQQNAAQQAANSAQQQQQQAQAQAQAAEAAAAAAQAQAQQAQAQMQQAQVEMDQIKQMVAAKQLNPVTFKTGSAELTAESSPALDKVADIAKKYPNLKLRVEGHTDNVGAADYNQTLSQQRADSVKDYLVKAGVPADQIVAIGFGKTRPVASNDTAEGRAQNRRVEFIFFLK